MTAYETPIIPYLIAMGYTKIDIPMIPKSSAIITVLCIFKDKRSEYEEFKIALKTPKKARILRAGSAGNQLSPRRINIKGLEKIKTKTPNGRTNPKIINRVRKKAFFSLSLSPEIFTYTGNVTLLKI